jgi:hypothetical protein
MSDPNLAQTIKQQFDSEFTHPFPTAEVGKLRSVDSKNLGQLHGELDLYFSSIAGYASSADRLARRPRAELIEARKKLSHSFFERHRSLIVYRDAIKQDFTPNLFRRLATADRLREELLVVIDDILGKESVQH